MRSVPPSLVVKPAAQLLVWKWSRGAATTQADYGNPTGGSSDYTLCIYDGASIALAADAPAGGTCSGRACWKTLGTTGFSYTDKAATPDGISKITLKAGAGGVAKIGVKAKGGNVPPVTLPLAQAPNVVVQLRRRDAPICWEAT